MLMQNIRFLARQSLPLRGHHDIDSNFIQLLLLRSSDRNDIVPWINKKTDKYTCHDIQDECLKILALQIVQEISGNIRNSGCFTIMADDSRNGVATQIQSEEKRVVYTHCYGHCLLNVASFQYETPLVIKAGSLFVLVRNLFS